MNHDELIKIAEGVLNPYAAKDRMFGDVGAALLSKAGHIHTGVSVDTPSWGLCAERSAMASMITSGEYRIAKIVALWRDACSAKLHVLPPCGTCREFMRSVDEGNLEAEIVLGRLKSVRLSELLPFHGWPAPLDSE